MKRVIPWVFVGLFAAAISRGDPPAPLLNLAIHREYAGGNEGVRVLPLAADENQVEIEFISGGKVRHRAQAALADFRRLTGWLSPDLDTLAGAARASRESRGRCGLGTFRVPSSNGFVEGEICENPRKRNFREGAAAARIIRVFGDRFWREPSE